PARGQNVDDRRQVLVLALAGQQFVTYQNNADPARPLHFLHLLLLPYQKSPIVCYDGAGRVATGKRGHQLVACFFTASSSMGLSSPDWNRSTIISEPPTSWPSTYSCGIVGQFEYSLMPWR